MKALYLKDSLALKEIPVPVFSENDALVKVKMAGICNTDLELVKGYMGFEGVLGHEFVGVVEKAANQEWVGKRICGEINFGCAECLYCKRGLSRHCPNRTVMGILKQNGAFAEYVVLPIRNLHEIPESIPNSSAVFVEPLAAGLEILEQIKIEPNCDLAVIGDGKLGLLICQLLRLTGCRLKLIGKHPKKLALAQSWGISTLKVDEMEDRKYDFVVEASGSPSGFARAMQLVRPRGTLVLKSTYQGSLELNAAPIVIDEITIVGSRCGPFEPAIRALENNLVKVDDLIDQTYPFSQALQAFEHAKQRGSLKIILDFDE
jgi:threonine dehydrogenase-like Zn-dependent dehydrogenase